MGQQTTPSMTGKQKRDIRRLLNDALDEMCLSNPEAQIVLGRGSNLKFGVKNLLAKLNTSGPLEVVGNVATPAIVSFRAQDYLSIPAKIGFIDDYFRNNFLVGDGKVETDIAEITLCVHRIVKDSTHAQIITELGGKEIAETSLAQMYELMKVQGQGQQGILLTNGYFNIFYIKDAKGVLWAAYCYWFSPFGCWHVLASPVTNPDAWSADCQVFSR